MHTKNTKYVVTREQEHDLFFMLITDGRFSAISSLKFFLIILLEIDLPYKQNILMHRVLLQCVIIFLENRLTACIQRIK